MSRCWCNRSVIGRGQVGRGFNERNYKRNRSVMDNMRKEQNILMKLEVKFLLEASNWENVIFGKLQE